MVKVTVLGAGGGVGQALSLQLRLSHHVDELALYDRNRAAGAAVDLSHIPVKQIVRGYKAHDDGLTKALTGADIVIVTAGPAIFLSGVFKDRNDLLEQNANIIGPMIKCCGEICPKALIIIVTNPVNAIVPFAAEILKKQKAFDARRLFGLTTLDVVRAETFLAEMLESKSDDRAGIEVDVVGGHSAETMVPLFSHVKVAESLSSEQLKALIYHVQYGGIEVFLAKGRTGAATLSTAYATFRMTERVCRALKGEKGLHECTFVSMAGIEGGNEIIEALGVKFFAASVEFAVDGALKIINPLKDLSDIERTMVEEGVKKLRDDTEMGIEFGKTF